MSVTRIICPGCGYVQMHCECPPVATPSVEGPSEKQPDESALGVVGGCLPVCESGTSQIERELMELEADEHETIAQWLDLYYESPALAAQHEAKAQSIRRRLAATTVRQPEDNIQG